MSYRLILRCFTRAPDAAAAQAQHERLLACLQDFAPRADAAPVPYWKIPGYFEHGFRLAPATDAAFDAVRAQAPGPWHGNDDGERWAVWNAAPDQAFLLPEVTWAEVLLVQDNPPGAG